MRIFFLAALIILAGLSALVIHIVPIYRNHNRAAQQVLDLLAGEPLPPQSTLLEKDWNISSYEGAGSLCEAGAFVIIRSSAFRPVVVSFYQSLFPAMGAKVDSDFHLAPLDGLPPLTSVPGDVNQVSARLTPEERKTTYIIWGIRPLDELGWDIRGW